MQPAFTLVVLEDDGAEKIFPLRSQVTIGRAPDAEIVLDVQGISRHHCALEVTPSGLELRDLGSTNGCYVNGVRVEQTQLHGGDTLILGRTRLKIIAEDSDLRGGQTVVLGSTSIEMAIDVTSRVFTPTDMGGERAPTFLAALYRITESINSDRTRGSLYRDSLDAMMEALGMDLGVIFVVQEPAGRLEPIEIVDHADRPNYEPSATVLSRVFQRGEAVVASDLGRSSDLAKVHSLVNAGVTRILAAPLLDQGKPYGAVYLSSLGSGPRADDEESFAFFNAAVKQIGHAGINRQHNRNLERECSLLREQQPPPQDRLIGNSPSLESLRGLMARAAKFNATVLVIGETGSGKELVARGIHSMSIGRTGLFVPVNCGAIPGSMMESELFGHEKGAFTGATERKIGKIEHAHKGTLFLDEIAELSAELQVKLLRVLEERSFCRVGGNEEVHVDVRFIAATHRNLEQRVRDGDFREDLLFRLQVLELQVPPLREHLDDVPEIARNLLERLAASANRKTPTLSERSIEHLKKHSWPGNVRELRNALERALILEDSETLEPDVLLLNPSRASKYGADGPLVTLKELEKEHIRRVLDATGWNKTSAAEVLGIGRPTIYEKIKAYGIEPSNR